MFSLLLVLVVGTLAHHGKGKSPLEESHVVPEVLDSVPPEVVHINHGSYSVEMGNVLTPSQTKDAPTLITWKSEPSKLYTVIMTDPDAPSRKTPLLREFRHWLVVNVPGHDISKGETCSGYVGPEPPQGTGLHRYIYAVFEQQGKVTVDTKLCAQQGLDRAKWSLKKFAQNYNLGPLVAANFFNSQYES